jgi:hypothetical protein
LESIQKSWADRRESIKSFYYKCTLEETINLPVASVVDPFKYGGVDPADKFGEATLTKALLYAFDSGKFAYQEEGVGWNPQLKKVASTRSISVANPTGVMTLLQTNEILHGSIDKRTWDGPAPSVILTARQGPFVLAFDPKLRLKRLGYDMNGMRIVDDRAFRRGHACSEVKLTRVGQGPTWIGLLYVDSSRDHIPISFIEQHQGATVSELNIEYAPLGTGWAVSSWREVRFDSDGSIERTEKGAVNERTINTAIDPQLFELSFPTGTRVVERSDGGKKFFIKDADGSLKPVKQKEPPAPVKKTPRPTLSVSDQS